MREKLYKRGGVWWCRVRDRRGRIVRRSTKCRDFQAAAHVAADIERASASEDHAAATETSFERGVNDYLDDLVRRGRSAATIAIAQQKTGHFIRLWGAAMPMARVSAKLASEYIDRRLSEGAARFTVKKELGHLGQILRLARHHRVFHLDVDQVIPPFFHGGHVPRTRWPTPEELLSLLDQLPSSRAAHVAFIVATGARKSEAFRARRSDVFLGRRVVRVRGTKTERADDEVPVTPLTDRLLDFALTRAPGRDRLFHPWQNMSRDLKAACERAGIAAVTPNDLRRAFGRWHRRAGVPVDIVAKMLRHTTDKLAQTTYARLAGEEVAALVGRALAGVPLLYQATADTDPNEDEPHDETGEKAAPPARIGLATFGLGNRSRERRSRGTKAGLRRKAGGAGVSILNADPPEPPAPPWPWGPGREFRLVGSELRQVSP